MEAENSWKTFSDIGFAKYQTSEYKEAIIACDKSHSLNPDESYPLYLLGCIYRAEKNYSLSISYFSKAIAIDKLYDYFFARGLCKYELEDYEGAIEDLNYAIILENRFKPNYYWIARCKFELRNFEDAFWELNKAFYLNTTCQSINKWYLKEDHLFSLRGEIHYELDNYEEAIKDLNKAIEMDSNNDDHFLLRAESKYELDEIEEALDDINKGLKINLKNQYLWNLMVHLNLKKEDDQNALVNINKAIEIDADEPWFYETRGICKMNLQKYEDAIADFDMGLAIDSEYKTSINLKEECMKEIENKKSYKSS